MSDTDPIPFDDDEGLVELNDDGESPPAAVYEPKPHKARCARMPNADGKGAVHVKTFHAKLRVDALDFLDEQINQWLEEHPEYEVKFSTATIGALVGKTTEPALFVMVWV
jgi:hypothetical protein